MSQRKLTSFAWIGQTSSALLWIFFAIACLFRSLCGIGERLVVVVHRVRLAEILV
jgi:hypothetical protein